MTYYHERNGMDDTALAGWVASSLAYLTGTCTDLPWTDATSERTEPMSTTTEPRRCRKARSLTIAFDCKLNAGHEGKCSPYTNRPPTRERWAALDPRNRYRVRIHLDDGTSIPLIWRADRAETERELAEQLPEFREMRQRHPYMAQVTGGDIEDRDEDR